MSNIEDEPPPVLLPCAICSRTFKPEVLERHVKVCEKTASKKRRVFDSFRSRVSGTELEEFFGPVPLPGQVSKRPNKSPVKKKVPSKWKETHENLIATLRAARGVDPPSEIVMEASKHTGNERCPSCSRFFGPRAFDRHVEFCKEKTARIKLTPSKVSQAQERLEARTKYRAPLSIKPKLTTKEKYSPMLTRKDSVESCSVSPTKTSPPTPILNRNIKPIKASSSNFSRQSPIRSSERQRSVSPEKKTSVSSSKSNVKSEAQVKPLNQPRIKENVRTPNDFKPKTGSRTSTQEKIRSSKPKPAQLEHETEKRLKKTKNRTREKIVVKPGPSSDSESIGTVDSEMSESREEQFRNKWASMKSLSRKKDKSAKTKTDVEDSEKVSLNSTNLEKRETKAKDEVKLGKKSKHQKPQINDLSVNDESFGIFVAACSIGPPSSSASKTSVKTIKESPTRSKAVENEKNIFSFSKVVEKEKNVISSSKIGENKLLTKSDNKGREHSTKRKTVEEITHNIENVAPEDFIKDLAIIHKSGRVEKISKIPKLKAETSSKLLLQKVTPEYTKLTETTPEMLLDMPKALQEIEENPSREERIQKKSKRWRNITDIPTEDLVHLSEDLDMPTTNEFQELSESAIWEIAAEQFLRSEEPTQSTSVFSIDSLNNNGNKKNLEFEVACKKETFGGDDLIVLHVTDPAKLIENDADMKLSISEPCFPYSDKVQKIKEKLSPECKKVDIVVFTASPNAIQHKITHRKRRKQRKARKPILLEQLYIREKTFLANDIPKAKRRKLSNQKMSSFRSFDLGEYCFEISSKKEMAERKKKFIEGLKSQREKIRRWQITANSHIRFIDEFGKSIEDDLKKLKNLSKSKKIRQSSLTGFKKEKLKKIEEEREKNPQKEIPKSNEKKFDKKFAYFEISLNDEIHQKESAPGKGEGVNENKKTIEDQKKMPISKPERKLFEFFEIENDDPCTNWNREKEKNVEKTTKPKDKREGEKRENLSKSPSNTRERTEEDDSLFFPADSVQALVHHNSFLENIEEVDETAENVEWLKIDIEIEDFIMSKPNVQKILTKKGNCLDELFPKPRKTAEIKTLPESATAVQLDFSANSVYDLKSNEKKRLKALSLISSRNKPTKILQKRMKKESQLPQIEVKNRNQKENSMMSLIEMWKNKKGSSGNEKAYKTKTTLPLGKLPPLTKMNSFQIATNSNDSYDPFKQAERQMLALLSWPSTIDIKTAKSLTPTPKPSQNSNLKTSATSAFIKYPNKNGKSVREGKTAINAIRNLNETFAVNEIKKKNNLNEKPTYTSADDWEQIFEKHFDLNRNEMMTEQMAKSVKSALDGLLISTMKYKSNVTEEKLSPEKNRNELTESSFVTDVLYTSTPKQNPKSDKSSKSRTKEIAVDLDQTPNTHLRKNSNFTYGRITPPEDFNDSLADSRKIDKANRNSGVSLSSLSFCSQISDTTLADEEVMRSNLEVIGKAAAAARTPRRKYARSQSVFDERNKMLFAKTYDPNCSSDENVEVPSKAMDKQGKKSPSLNPYPKSAPSHFYRSQSVVDDRCKGDKENHPEDGDQMSSPESSRNRKAKLSGDSAYSSLNRRSPRLSSQRNHNEDRLSSSGSEHSLQAINDYDLKPKLLDFENCPPSPKKDQPAVKMSKFCHECGAKYPLAVAKFCCECGVRRLII